MGSKQPKPVTQTNTVQLSKQQKQIADLAFPFAKEYANKTITLPNPVIAGFNANEVEGQNAALAAARGGMNDQMQLAAAANSMLLNPAFLSPDSNPAVQAAANAVAQQTTQNLMENILPGLRSGSVVSGGFYGGGATRQGLAEGKAVGDTNQNISNAIANLYNDAYKTNLAAQGAAIDRSGTVGTNLLKPATAIAGVGAQQREMEQANLDAKAQYAWINEQLPFIRAQQLYGLLGGMPGGSGVSTVTGSSPQSGGVGGALGGALSGAALGSAIPGVGTVAGGLLGGLGGWFS